MWPWTLICPSVYKEPLQIRFALTIYKVSAHYATTFSAFYVPCTIVYLQGYVYFLCSTRFKQYKKPIFVFLRVHLWETRISLFSTIHTWTIKGSSLLLWSSASFKEYISRNWILIMDITDTEHDFISNSGETALLTRWFLSNLCSWILDKKCVLIQTIHFHPDRA